MNKIDGIIKRMISMNNHNMKISCPAVVIGVENLKDCFIDVQPIVNYTNYLTGESSTYPSIYNVRVCYPSTKTTSICFPINQGDFVDLVFQSSNIEKFINGNEETHDPKITSFGNLSDVVAYVGFEPYQKSCMNPNNYVNDFNNQDLNIVHNKNTGEEVVLKLMTSGELRIQSPNKVHVEAPEVVLDTDVIDAKNALIKTDNDVLIKGKSVYQHQTLHTHPYTDDGKPMTTSPPNPM